MTTNRPLTGNSSQVLLDSSRGSELRLTGLPVALTGSRLLASGSIQCPAIFWGTQAIVTTIRLLVPGSLTRVGGTECYWNLKETYLSGCLAGEDSSDRLLSK